jgi:hypothetical protein
MTETQEMWFARVQEWKASGQTAREFAQGRDFNAATLGYWAYRLRRAGEQSVEGTPATSAVRLARVVRTPVIGDVESRGSDHAASGQSEAVGVAAAAKVGASDSLRVCVGAVHVEVRRGFDRALLREVIEALGGVM